MFLCYSSYLPFSIFYFHTFWSLPRRATVPIVYIWDLSCLVSVFLVYHIAIYQHTHTQYIAQLVDRSPRLQVECRWFESHLRQLLFPLEKSCQRGMWWDGQVWFLPHLVSPPLHGHSQRGVWRILGPLGVQEVCEDTHLAGTTGRSAVCDSDSNCLLEVSPRYYQHSRLKKLICRFGVIREEVASICVRNFLLTEGKVYKFLFIYVPVLFCLVLMFLLKHFLVHTYIHLWAQMWLYLCHVNFCFQQC